MSSWFQAAPAAADDSSGVAGADAAVSSLSYKQRLGMFVGLGALSVVFFGLSSMSILMPVKFAKLYFLGSFFLVSALAFLVGPGTLLVSAFQGQRLPSTLGYLGSTAATLFFATYVESSLLTLAAMAVQVACSAWLILSFLPFGTQMFGVARSLLPI